MRTRAHMVLVSGRSELLYITAMRRLFGSRRRGIATSLLMCLSYLILVESGFGCTWLSMSTRTSTDVGMTDMGMADMPIGSVATIADTPTTDGSSAVTQSSRTPEHQGPNHSGCQFPWGPTGCHTMTPCAPATMAGQPITYAASPMSAVSVEVGRSIAPPSLTRLPELPPPRA